MTQVRLGAKWDKGELGGIYRYMSSIGSPQEGAVTAMADKQDMMVTAGDSEGDETDIDIPNAEGNPPIEEEPISADDAMVQTMSILMYVTAVADISPVFNMMADFLKLPPDHRKMEMDDKVDWMARNLDKLSPEAKVSVYRAIKKLT